MTISINLYFRLIIPREYKLDRDDEAYTRTLPNIFSHLSGERLHWPGQIFES